MSLVPTLRENIPRPWRRCRRRTCCRGRLPGGLGVDPTSGTKAYDVARVACGSARASCSRESPIEESLLKPPTVHILMSVDYVSLVGTTAIVDGTTARHASQSKNFGVHLGGPAAVVEAVQQMGRSLPSGMGAGVAPPRRTRGRVRAPRRRGGLDAPHATRAAAPSAARVFRARSGLTKLIADGRTPYQFLGEVWVNERG